MTKGLRKKHLQIWTLWAVLLPVGIIAAWLAVPEKVTDKLLQPEPGNALTVLLNSVERANYTVNLKTNEDKSIFQVEWINKESSTVPSSLIYKISKPENELLGRVEAKGVYHFNLAKDSAGSYSFILYDIIKKQTIDSVIFKTLRP